MEQTPKSASVVDRVLEWALMLLGLGLIAMVCLSVYNVIARYLFNRALLWADEIAVFAMIVVVWLGAVAGAWRSTEIRMDIILNILPEKVRQPLLVVQEIVTALLLGWLSWISFTYVARIFQFGMRSDTAGIPTWFVHSAIPVSLGLIAAIAVTRLVRLLRRDGVSKTVPPLKDFVE